MSPPAQVLSKRTTTASTTPNASSTPNNTNTIDAFANTNGGLSIGAKAGIALAALIITALILVGILFLMKRTKGARKASMVDLTSEWSSGASESVKAEEIAMLSEKDVPRKDMNAIS